MLAVRLRRRPRRTTAVLQGRLVHVAFRRSHCRRNGGPRRAQDAKRCREPTGRFDSRIWRPARTTCSFRTQGYSSRRTEVTVTAMPERTRSTFASIPISTSREVASVTAEARSQFDVMPADDCARRAGARQADRKLASGRRSRTSPALRSAASDRRHRGPSFAASTAIACLILQDGQRTGDLSSQSGDHGVTVNPASAETIEVVRGPATLLYGANAIGGLVNVITNEIPRRPGQRPSGKVTFDAGTAAEEGWRRRTGSTRQRQIRRQCGRRRPPVGRFRDAGRRSD